MVLFPNFFLFLFYPFITETGTLSPIRVPVSLFSDLSIAALRLSEQQKALNNHNIQEKNSGNANDKFFVQAFPLSLAVDKHL